MARAGDILSSETLKQNFADMPPPLLQDEALMESARLAEDIVGHPLPGSVMRGGSLHALREQVAAAKAA